MQNTHRCAFIMGVGAENVLEKAIPCAITMTQTQNAARVLSQKFPAGVRGTGDRAAHPHRGDGKQRLTRGCDRQSPCGTARHRSEGQFRTDEGRNHVPGTVFPQAQERDLPPARLLSGSAHGNAPYTERSNFSENLSFATGHKRTLIC